MLWLALLLGGESVWASEPVLTRAPELLRDVQPEYPVEALESRAEGVVVLIIDIDSTGSVIAVDIGRAPHPSLAEAARKAAWSMRFSPAEVDGTPAAVRIEFTYQFDLELPPPPPTPLDSQRND